MPRPNKTILCIDDHWNALITRKLLLERNGYYVFETSTASEGLRLFLSHPVDAVIVDYQLPVINGAALAAEMKLLKPHVPIMLLSAYGPLPPAKLKAVDSFLPESQPPKVLLSTLQDMLNGWSKPFFYQWLDQWKNRNPGAKV